MPAIFQNLILKALAVIIWLQVRRSPSDIEQAQRVAKELESSADLADL